ncbi:MAG: FapA family protein [Proteobacteria bacterium]|nr:FapA family protein [Pseudomonadota bacterium]
MTQQLNEATPVKEDAIPLPACLIRQQDGIFVDLSLFPVGGFDVFIDSLFGDGVRFRGLDYRLLTGLLYDYDSIMEAHGIAAKLRLADDVVPFSPKRQTLYKAVKVDAKKQRAAYFFEPVAIELVIEEPVYGEPGEDGVSPIVGATRREVLQPTKLDVDEFIADMWLKDVRFGIDTGAVAGVISRGESVRLDVAVQLDPTPGSDAEIEEACNVLHRDNSPKLLVNGKADLRKFQNRFPQIAAGARLLKKKSRILGKPGYKVDGEMIASAIPQDEIDLYAMSGPGTRVEIQDGCEYILAEQDGFLSLDVMSNNISVTEMIENKGGISLKTTGDLSLTGNEFIEHGEVQEGRVVEGKNMTFRSDVYGDVVSQGGFILLEKNMSGGSARSYGGDVTSNGRVFNSVIEACTGQVSLQYAESCLILGESVVIDRAVNCDIVAENIQVGSAEGCGIAGKAVQVNSSSACRSKETLISMLVPNLSVLDAQIAQMSREIEDCNLIVEAKNRELALLKSDAEFAKYLALATSIRQGKIQLNAAQQDGWQKMTAKFAGSMSAGSKLSAEKQEQLTRAQAFLQEQAHLLAAREKSCAGIRCEITEVAGDTSVQSMIAPNGVAAFQKYQPGEIRSRLREHDVKHTRIFSDDTGSLVWSYEVAAKA